MHFIKYADGRSGNKSLVAAPLWAATYHEAPVMVIHESENKRVKFCISKVLLPLLPAVMLLLGTDKQVFDFFLKRLAYFIP
jgi:hypothetical protein